MAPMPGSVRMSPSFIYQLKVTLKGVRPPIWRRLLVPGDVSFARLHDILQLAMGWEGAHLHQFEVGSRRIAMKGGEFEDDLPAEDERRVRLVERVRLAKTRFSYEYDFGDSWIHDILVEKIHAPEPGIRYPQCVAGRRACPPEDSGGAWGYRELLRKLAHPKHEEHKEVLEWLGGAFDPEAFDLDRVNAGLARQSW